MSEPRFPIGGPRQAVYDFFKENGWTMAPSSDKHWTKPGGLRAHLYGTGSRVRIFKDDVQIADGPLEETLLRAGA